MTAPYRTPWEPPAERRHACREPQWRLALALIGVALLAAYVVMTGPEWTWVLDVAGSVLFGLGTCGPRWCRVCADNDTPAASGTRASNEGGE